MEIAGVDSTGRLRSSRSLLKQHTVDCSSDSIESVQGFWGYKVADCPKAPVYQHPRLVDAYTSHRKEWRLLPILSSAGQDVQNHYTGVLDVNSSDDGVATIVWPAV